MFTKVTCSNRLMNNHLICTLRTTLSFPTTNLHLEGTDRNERGGATIWNGCLLRFKISTLSVQGKHAVENMLHWLVGIIFLLQVNTNSTKWLTSMCSSRHLGSISPSQLLLRIIANRQVTFPKRMVQGKWRSKKTTKKSQLSGSQRCTWYMCTVCLSKVVFETRLENTERQAVNWHRAAGKLRAQRETLEVFFHACQVGSRLKRTEERCALGVDGLGLSRPWALTSTHMKRKLRVICWLSCEMTAFASSTDSRACCRPALLALSNYLLLLPPSVSAASHRKGIQHIGAFDTGGKFKYFITVSLLYLRICFFLSTFYFYCLHWSTNICVFYFLHWIKCC